MVLNVWYLDDGMLVGNWEALVAAWDLLAEEGEPRGLHLSREKSLVFCPHYDPSALYPLGRGVTKGQGGGFKLLGASLGDEEYVEEVLEGRLVGTQQMLDSLPTLEARRWQGLDALGWRGLGTGYVSSPAKLLASTSGGWSLWQQGSTGWACQSSPWRQSAPCQGVGW